MTLKRMDNNGIVVESMSLVIAFFIAPPIVRGRTLLGDSYMTTL